MVHWIESQSGAKQPAIDLAAVDWQFGLGIASHYRRELPHIGCGPSPLEIALRGQGALACEIMMHLGVFTCSCLQFW